MKSPQVDDPIRELQSTDSYVRIRAKRSVMSALDDGILRTIPLLSHHDPEIRALALEIVGGGTILPYYYYAREVREKVIGTASDTIIALTHDPATNIRRRAIKALVNLRHPDAEQVLVSALNDRDWTIRRDAAKALERLRGS